MVKKIFKFIAILFGTGFLMILLASFIPVLQTAFFGFATYILPWIVAILFTKKKKTATKPIKAAATNQPVQSHSVTKSPAPTRKPIAVQEKPIHAKTSPIIQQSKDSSAVSPAEATVTTQAKPDTKTKTYKVAGPEYHVDNIMNLAFENSDYDMSKRDLIDCGFIEEKIWKYNFYPSKLELQPEPENPHDPNAIKVIIDGEHVGYIKKGSCAHIKRIIEDGSLVKADCEMGGGPYKFISEDYDYDKDKEVYSLERDETKFFVHLKITEKV